MRAARSAALLALALLAQAARAAVPVVLPAGEAPEVWADTLGMAGLAPGTAGEGAWVELIDRGGRWLIRVDAGAGKVAEVSVPPPRTEREREDLVWLAHSLLRPASGGESWEDVPALAARSSPPPRGTTTGSPAARPPVATPGAKTHAPPSATPAVSLVESPVESPVVWGGVAPVASPVKGTPAGAEATSGAPTPPTAARPAGGAAQPDAVYLDPAQRDVAAPPAATPPAATPPAATPPAATPPAATPPAASRPAAAQPAAPELAASRPEALPEVTRAAPDGAAPRVSAWVQAGAGVGWRPDATFAPDFGVAGGARLGPGLQFGGGVEWTLARSLASLGGDRSVEAVDLVARAGWTLVPRLSPTVTLLGGVSIRSYEQEDVHILTAPVPFAGALGSVTLPLAGVASVSPYVSVRADLRSIAVHVGQSEAGTLSPVELAVGLNFVVTSRTVR